MAAKPTVTVLTPVFNEENNILRYEQEVSRILLADADTDFQVLFIEDGSGDNSWKTIEQVCARNPRFRAIRLSRNFGSHVALSAGFAHAQGDAVATLACDLQDPPETVVRFVEKWKAGAQIVWGRRQSRKDTAWRVLTSKLFYEALRRFAMPKGSKFATGSFLLADRLVVDAFLRFEESHRTTFALIAWTGFDQDVVLYDRRQRIAGKSGWTFRQMIRSMIDAFMGFSTLPITIVTWTGLIVSGMNVLFCVYLVASWWFKHPVQGWTSTMLLISIFFGVHFLMLGMLGEYLRRIYSEAVRRPLYFISRKI